MSRQCLIVSLFYNLDQIYFIDICYAFVLDNSFCFFSIWKKTLGRKIHLLTPHKFSISFSVLFQILQPSDKLYEYTSQ